MPFYWTHGFHITPLKVLNKGGYFNISNKNKIPEMQNQKNVNSFIIARFSKTHLSSQYKYIFFGNNIQEILLNSFSLILISRK